VNTAGDFVRKVDTAAHADDRTLVEGRLPLRAVLTLAAAHLAGAAALFYHVFTAQGALGAPIALLAAALGVLYTAWPFSLKRVALGDAAIFLAFGPLLVAGMVLCAAGREAVGSKCPKATAAAADAGLMALTSPVLLRKALRCANALAPAGLAFSTAVGLAVVQILHANNARDAAADRAGGVLTCARALGWRGSVWYFRANYWLAFAAAGLGFVQHRMALLGLKAELQVMGGVLWRAAGELRAAVAQCASARTTEACMGALRGGEEGYLRAVLPGVLQALVLLLALTQCSEELMRRFEARQLRTLPQACAPFALALAVGILCTGDFFEGTAPTWAPPALRFAFAAAALLLMAPVMAAAGERADFAAAERVPPADAPAAATTTQPQPRKRRGSTPADAPAAVTTTQPQPRKRRGSSASPNKKKKNPQ
jgi:1,4-dihydroxy-2-naphthoate octaprenyltransferase